MVVVSSLISQKISDRRSDNFHALPATVMTINPRKHLGWTAKLFTHPVPGNGESSGDGYLEAISGFVEGWPPGFGASDWLKHFRRYKMADWWQGAAEEHGCSVSPSHQRLWKGKERTHGRTHTNIWRSQARDLLIVKNQSCVTSRTKLAQTGKKN